MSPASMAIAYVLHPLPVGERVATPALSGGSRVRGARKFNSGSESPSPDPLPFGERRRKGRNRSHAIAPPPPVIAATAPARRASR